MNMNMNMNMYMNMNMNMNMNRTGQDLLRSRRNLYLKYA